MLRRCLVWLLLGCCLCLALPTPAVAQAAPPTAPRNISDHAGADQRAKTRAARHL